MGFARAAGTLLMMGRWGVEEQVDEAEAEGVGDGRRGGLREGRALLLLLLLRRRRRCLQACIACLGLQEAGEPSGSRSCSCLLAYSLPADRYLHENEIVVIPEDAFLYNTALVYLCVAGAGWRFHGLGEGRGVGGC